MLGGGAGGLYLSRLLKRQWPHWHVDVFEQNPQDATFGFGVTLGGSSLGRLGETDPVFVKRLSAAAILNGRHAIDLNGDRFVIDYAESGASIERLAMLDILRELSSDVGVRLHYEHRVGSIEEVADYDLVVGADGANSQVRSESVSFDVRGHLLTNRFAWYGVDRALEPSALVFRSALGGACVAHYYAYKRDMSTFVAECDEAAWFGGGLDGMTDDQRRAVFEDVFAPELAGAKLVDNRSIYRQFPAVAAETWVDGNVVLIGDAQRVAHFSIGSGTRLALDDAQALFEAMRDAQPLPAALALFVERRKPVRDRFAEAAKRSYEWYEQVGHAMRQPLMEFVHDFLTRTGRVDDARLAVYAPDFARAYADYRRKAAVAATEMQPGARGEAIA